MGNTSGALAGRATTQLGLITTGDLAELDVSAFQVRRRVRAGELVPVHRGVWRTASTPPTWRQSLRGACLAGGRDAYLSHRAAAVLHRMDGFTRAPVEVTTVRSRNRFGPGVVVHRPLVTPASLLTMVDDLPVAGIPLVLVQLGSVCHRSQVEHALDGVLRDGRTDLAEIRDCLDLVARRGRSGVGVLRTLLGPEEARPTSVLERRFLRVVRRAGLPEPVCQFVARDEFGHPIATVDFAWPDLGVYVEVDGHGSHATRADRARDARRENGLKLAGLVPLRFTYEQVTNEPSAVLGQLRRAFDLARSGRDSER